MKIVLLQTDICWTDIDENLRRAEEMIKVADNADLYVLPEMFSTGFVTEPTSIAEQKGGKTVQWLKEMAMKKGCALCGSVAVEDEGKFFNRLYFVKPDGTVNHYDKRHLFSYGGEHKHFTVGENRVVVEHCGVKILLQVCYDLRFPVFSRNDAANPYDMIIYVANWPESRIDVWNTLLKARAIENQCYVAGVNRVGDDPVCHYSGGTTFIDPYGKIIARCADNQPDAISAVVDMERLMAFRKKFPVLQDAD